MTEIQRFVALDLEFNQPSRRIIQVGVALGTLGQPEVTYQVRSWLLDPGEPVAPEITQLTGITDDAIAAGAVPLSKVAVELGAMLSQGPVFVNPVTWGGGDAETLLAAFREGGIAFPHFGRRWLDVKTMHSLLRLAQGKNPSGGLRSIMAQYGLAFSGMPHRADVDALNTLRLFFRLLERQGRLLAAADLLKIT